MARLHIETTQDLTTIADFRTFARLPVPEPRKELMRMKSKMSDSIAHFRQKQHEATMEATIPPCTSQGVGKISCCTGKNNTTQRQHAPSRRCPGTLPNGQTKQPQSSVQNQDRVYISSYGSRNYRRRLHRSLWRWFKRTKLWGRANKVAQEHLKNSNVSKRKTFSPLQKWKIQLKSKQWFPKQ